MKNDRSEKFFWNDGDLKIVYNPNDVGKKSSSIDTDGKNKEQQMFAHEGKEKPYEPKDQFSE